MSATPSDAEICRATARQADPDRYLAGLLAPGARRRGLFALYAFNAELARVREMVSDPAIGEIRLQWWFDTLGEIERGGEPQAPVARELAWLIAEAKLPVRTPQNMVEARRFDLYDDAMPSLNDLEGYLGETASALFQLSALSTAGRAARNCAEIAGLAGVAFGIAGLLRSLPLHRARGQCYLPADMLKAHGLTPAHVIAGRDSPDLVTVLGVLIGHARDRLDEARALQATVPHAARPALLPLALVNGYLRALGKAGTAILTATPATSQVQRQWWLWKAALRGRF